MIDINDTDAKVLDKAKIYEAMIRRNYIFSVVAQFILDNPNCAHREIVKSIGENTENYAYISINDAIRRMENRNILTKEDGKYTVNKDYLIHIQIPKPEFKLGFD